MHHGSGITCLFFIADKFVCLTHHGVAFRYRQASTGVGRGNASVDVYDLTKRSKLPHVLRSRMKYLPDFIAALKEAYRQPTVAS